MHQTVNVKTVVATASSVLPNVSDEEKILMRDWVYLAMREVGPTSVDRVTDHRIPVNDFVVPKPSDCMYIEDIAFLTADLGEIRYVIDGKGEALHDKSNAIWNYVHVSDSSDYFTLSNNAGNVKWCKMTYLALPLDENGFPKVPDRAVLAVVMFLRAMWYMRQGKEAIGSGLLVEWNKLKIRARASMKTPAKLTHAEFAKAWLSMIDKSLDKAKYEN